MTAAEGWSSYLKLACLQPVRWNALRCHHRQCHGCEGQLALVRGHQLRSIKGPPGWEGKTARTSGFGLSRIEQHTGKVCSFTAWATKVHGIGKQTEQPSSFTEHMVLMAARMAAGKTYLSLDMECPWIIVGWGWKVILKKVLWLFILLKTGQSSLPRREGHYTSRNTSVSPPVQLSITASVTGPSFRGAPLVRGQFCTQKSPRLSLLLTKGRSPSLAQQPETRKICSPAFISCSWERRTQFLMNHVLAVVTQYRPCVFCPSMQEQCWHPLKAAHPNSTRAGFSQGSTPPLN